MTFLKAIVLILVFYFCLYPSRVLTQENTGRIPNYYFKNPQRIGSVFSHDLHTDVLEYDCYLCHHNYNSDDSESSEDMFCIECHNKDTNESLLSLKKSFHILCKDCHNQKKNGPIMCGHCHRKQ